MAFFTRLLLMRNSINHYLKQISAFAVLGFIICAKLQAQVLEETAIGISSGSYPIHASDLLWKQELEVRKFVAQHPEALRSRALKKTNAWGFTLGSAKLWYADNFTNNSRYQVPSTCKGIGANCFIFVEDASWNTNLVTQDAVDSVRIYFDSKTPADPSRGIFETDTSAFGDPPDVDSDPKIIILLLNILDGYTGSGGFVGGYFYSFNEVDPSIPGYHTSNFAEIFYIDTNPMDLKTSNGLKEAMSTLAHEFQHMIHFNYDPLEITFVNESLSLLAEVNCGFPIYDPILYANEPNHDLFDWRNNDMTAVLKDYSRAARFSVYMRDQCGMGIFKYIVASDLHGIAGIDEGLQASGSSLRFNDILSNWFIANIVNDRTINPLYGYAYPNLPKSAELVSLKPNAASIRDTVETCAVEYLAFKGGTNLNANFISSNSSLIIKAVETGISAKRVLDVPKNIVFSEPEFGTTYNEIHFVVTNLNPDSRAIYYYTVSGSGGYNQTVLSYAGNTRYYIVLPSSNQKFAMRFSPTVSGQLFFVSVAINGVAGAIKGNGNLRVSVHQNVSGSIAGIPGDQIGTSVDQPFSQLASGWNEINMMPSNISVTQGTDFQIVLEVIGTVGDTLQFLLDDGTKHINRTSSYRDGVPGAGWYNRADPNYASGKAPSYENLLLKSTIATDISQNPNPVYYALVQNFPNPFNHSTTIQFLNTMAAFMELKVYDIRGREVTTLVNGYMEAGLHSVEFNASDLSSGIYFYRITAGTFMETKKLVFIK
jgi:hypothetical protein